MSFDEKLKTAVERLQQALGRPLRKEQIKVLSFVLQGYDVYLAGKPGTGKTSIFTKGSEAGIFPRRIYILDMKLLAKKPMDEILDELDMYKDDDIVLDDVGIEGDDKEFGNLKEVLETVLRYREIYCSHCHTHITTNLTIKVFGARYGERVLSRMRTYQHVGFAGEDLRIPTARSDNATPAPLKDDAEPMEKWSDEDLQFEIEKLEEKIAYYRTSTFDFLPETITRNEEMLARYKAEQKRRKSAAGNKK